MRRRDAGLLVLGGLCAMALSMSGGGCQPEGDTFAPAGPGGTTGEGGVEASSGEGARADGAGAATAGSGDEGGGRGEQPSAARVVTIEEITTGAIAGDTVVELKGVVAMSPKFFIDSIRSGACLWGVFLSSPGLAETAAHSGILAVSRSDALTDENGEPACPSLESASAGDPFPDDVAPGELLDVIGETTYFSSSSCRDTCGDLLCDPAGDPPETAESCWQDCGASPELIGQSAVGQYQLEWIESATRRGRTDAPAPHVLTADEAAKLGSPAETDFYHAWGGVKVRLEGAFDPVLRTDAAGEHAVVGAHGNIHLQGGPVQVGNKLYTIGGAQSACHKRPIYSSVDVVFTRVDGFVYNNFCIWSLQPASKCTDIAPPSEDCAAANPMCP